jgi:hypothetical protein
MEIDRAGLSIAMGSVLIIHVNADLGAVEEGGGGDNRDSPQEAGLGLRGFDALQAMGPLWRLLASDLVLRGANGGDETDSERRHIAQEILEDVCPPCCALSAVSVEGRCETNSKEEEYATCSICLEALYLDRAAVTAVSVLLCRAYSDSVPPDAATTAAAVLSRVASYVPGPYRRLPCAHRFHAHCIDAWLLPRFDSDEVQFDCPVCRKLVV